MSRRAFRVAVEAPRPASAWLLVTVAGATLWITEQLAVWAVLAQVTAILLSLARRRNPHRWQSDDIALNIGMFAIVAATIHVALRGGPSTIALAHFAALTQGLQLLDARPRRTEYLLVALALFQVVLAANLTDSVFFTPLLIAFLLSTVWTLLVHTLRSEAIEAGAPASVHRALTPALVRLTLVASGAAIVLALVLFVLLPRMRTSMLTASTGAARVATSGFSNTVSLGDLGRIRQDPTVVMRVETLEGDPPPRSRAYWRGLAFDSFDGRSWSITPNRRLPIAGSVEGGVTLGPHPERTNLAQRIVREPVEGGVIFGMGDPRRLRGTVRRLERDPNGSLYAAGQADERIRYTLATESRELGDAALRRDRALPPERDGDRFLSLPALSPEVRALAQRVAGGATNDADRVRALEHYLLREGRYSDTPPTLDPAGSESPIEQFLFGGLSAHCEYFASALVVLARSLDIPARLVNGFAGGRRNQIGGFVELTRSDAHAWVEVHYERAGWVRYDATPADLRTRPEVPLTFAARLHELGSAAELWWFQSVVGFDRSDQIHALKRAWLAFRGTSEPWQAAGPRTARGKTWRPDLELPLAELFGLVASAAAAAWLVRRHRDALHAPVHADYATALQLLRRRGAVRGAAVTAFDFQQSVAAAFPEPASGAFGQLTEAYLEERFAGRPAAATGEALRVLRRALRRRS